MRYAETIGIVGGMGSYATLDFFRRILEAFPAEKEWDRPRVVIDNRCTMPSRVRAILYQEEKELLVNELAGSVLGLLDCGADHIIFACNTSHVFLQDVFQRVPEARLKTVHMIETLADQLDNCGIKSVYLLATEGTIQSNIYQNTFDRYGIRVDSPAPAGWTLLRDFIEIVKAGRATRDAKDRFRKFCADIPNEHIILGCTEFPVLLSSGELTEGKTLWDPLDSAIGYIKSIIK